MKTFHPATLVAFAALLSSAAQADVPRVDARGFGAQIRCNVSPLGDVMAVHADKIIYRLSGPMQAMAPQDQPALDAVPRGTPLDIKVIDDPRTIADLKGKVLTFMGAVDNAVNRQAVTIDDVEYAMLCPVRPFALPQ